MVAVAGSAAFPACSSSNSGLQLSTHSFPYDGLRRVWYSYRPTKASGPGPVLVLLPGFQEAPSSIATVTGLLDDAAHDGFTIVAPEAIKGSWDAGTCCGSAALDHVDDTGFLTALIADLDTTRVANPTRVYLAGFSNGAMMTLALACSRPDLLAGAAVIEGTLTSSCGPHRPLSLLVVHQTADPIVPLNGSAHPPAVLDTTGPFPPVADAVEAWLTSEGCGRQALPAAPAAGQLDRTVLPCPGSTTTIFDLAGGGSHVWPLRAPLDATAELIRFFNLGS